MLDKLSRSLDLDDNALARAARQDFPAWMEHVRAASRCARPVRLQGQIYTATKTGGRAVITGVTSTERMPDGVIYKACGDRRASVCPACSKVYQRDAFQIVRAGLVGGDGVPATVAEHPAGFATFTAPSFGAVHTRVVRRHTCRNRKACDCVPERCHARRDDPRCPHRRPVFCFARHELADRCLGTPLCLDCYDHEGQVVWNRYAGELWRRTKQAVDRHLAGLAKRRGIPRVVVGIDPSTGRPRTVAPVRVSCGKVAEFQARGVVHFHSVMRLEGVDATDPAAVVPPPAGFTATDLHDAVFEAARQIRFATPAHPDQPHGWLITWGDQIDVKTVAVKGTDTVNDLHVAGYVAKYATKAAETVGVQASRFTEDTIHAYANFGGNHVQRLLAACWKLGRRLTTTPVDLHRPRDPRLTFAHPCPGCGTVTTLVRCEVCHPDPEHGEQADADEPMPAAPRPPRPDDPAYFEGLQRRAHMLGFGGHFYTQSRRYSCTFTHKRAQRTAHRRRQNQPPQGIPADRDEAGEETVLVISSLSFAGMGWHTTADALLAQTSSALAREHQQLARHLIQAKGF